MWHYRAMGTWSETLSDSADFSSFFMRSVALLFASASSVSLIIPCKFPNCSIPRVFCQIHPLHRTIDHPYLEIFHTFQPRQGRYLRKPGWTAQVGDRWSGADYNEDSNYINSSRKQHISAGEWKISPHERGARFSRSKSNAEFSMRGGDAMIKEIVTALMIINQLQVSSAIWTREVLNGTACCLPRNERIYEIPYPLTVRM